MFLSSAPTETIYVKFAHFPLNRTLDARQESPDSDKTDEAP
jgi:hypothetical protein